MSADVAEASKMTLNPFDAMWRENPYPLYSQLREKGGLVLLDEGFYVAASHKAVGQILRDTKRFSSQNRMVRRKMEMGVAMSAFSQHLQQRDPPDHTPVRAIMQAAFSAPKIARMEPYVRSLIDDLLAGPARDGGMDLSKDFAYLLPLTIVTGMLGVPREEMNLFRDWGDAFALAQGRKVSPEAIAGADAAMTEAQAYFRDMANNRRKNPREDLMTDFVTLTHNGIGMTEREVLVNCPMLITAGHESTANMIANGMHAFFRFPDEWQRLCADPSLAVGTVEEVLRYDPPVQLSTRIANEDVEIADVTVKADKSVTIAFAAANRDESIFPDPDRFDIGRTPAATHMAFGMGRHFCLGAALARLEGRLAFETLCTRFPAMRAAGTPARLPTETVRGFSSYPVTF